MLRDYKVFFVYVGRQRKGNVILGYDALKHKIYELASSISFSPSDVIEAYLWGEKRGDLVNGKVFLVADEFPDLVHFPTAGVYHLGSCERCSAETCDVCPTFECVGCKLGD